MCYTEEHRDLVNHLASGVMKEELINKIETGMSVYEELGKYKKLFEMACFYIGIDDECPATKDYDHLKCYRGCSLCWQEFFKYRFSQEVNTITETPPLSSVQPENEEKDSGIKI